MHIAIVALNAYPAINPAAGRQVGGLENFAWTLATELAALPTLQVSIFVRHVRRVARSQERGVHVVETIERLRDVRRNVSKLIERQATFPWITLRRWESRLLYQLPLLAVRRSFGPNLPVEQRIDRMLDRSRPDVVLALGISADSAAALQVAQQRGVPSLLWVRSNADLESNFATDSQFVNCYGVRSEHFHQAVTCSRAILCQMEWQRQQLRRLTGHESVVVKNPVDVSRFSPEGKAAGDREGVLWIGRYDRFHKRPLLAIEIAERCPSLRFRMVINRGDDDVRRELLSRLPPNVEVLDYVGRDRMPELYRQAQMFLSTGVSAVEGFPNVLLEAAASGTPIVSLEEFDQFVGSSGAGLVTGVDPVAAASACQRLATAAELWSECSLAGPRYVAREHSLDATVRGVLDVAKAVGR